MNVGELRKLIEHVDDDAAIHTYGYAGQAFDVDSATLVPARAAIRGAPRPVPILLLRGAPTWRGTVSEILEP